MPAYAYCAVDLAGRRIRGREDAPSPTALTRALEARGLVLLDLAEGADGEAAAAQAGFRFGRGQAVLDVTRAVAALLAAGLPLARALKAAAHVATGEASDVVEAVRARVERGDALAAALAAHPHFFPPLYVGLVRAGERSGDLAGAFRRLAAQLERDEQLRARLLSLALYPLILAVAGAGALAVLIFVVLPRFAELLTGTGAALPRSTAAVLAAAHAVRSGWPLLLAGLVAVPLVASWARRTDPGRRAWARILLELPLVRRLRREALAARTARILAVLLSGGAPLLGALEETEASLHDPIVRDELARIRARVRAGAALHEAVGEGGLFPPLFGQLMAVGEESGRIAQFAEKAAEIFEERTERAAQRLVTLLEPAMIVTLGVVVAFVALSVLQAIYSVNAGSFR